jgi:hypothetical protein
MRTLRLVTKVTTGSKAAAVGASGKLTVRSRISMRLGELKINLDQLITSGER